MPRECGGRKGGARRLLNGEVPGVTPIPHLPLGRKKVVPRSQFEKWKAANISAMIPSDSKQDEDAMQKGNYAS